MSSFRLRKRQDKNSWTSCCSYDWNCAKTSEKDLWKRRKARSSDCVEEPCCDVLAFRYVLRNSMSWVETLPWYELRLLRTGFYFRLTRLLAKLGVAKMHCKMEFMKQV